MNSTIEILSNKLIEVVKSPHYKSNGIQVYDLNFGDYFSISNIMDSEAEFSCKVISAEMAVDIIDLTNQKLELPKIDRTLVTGQIYNEILSNEIDTEKELYLNYYKYSKNII